MTSRTSSVKVRMLSESLVGILLAIGIAGPDAARADPIPLERARTIFDEARELGPSSPWPGRLAGPLLVVEAVTRRVVANEPDEEGHLTPSDGVWVGTLPHGEAIANTAIDWSGTRWTMLRWPLPVGHHERRRLLAHELFHRLGPEIGLPMASPMNAHLDSETGRLWIRLELRALARALATVGEERLAAIADALAFRARRHDAHPGAAAEERALELNEGLAEYTGIRVAIPERARAGWAVKSIEGYDARAGSEPMTRSFAYATGPAYGLLLDDAAPGWHERVDASTDLPAVLAGALALDPTPTEDLDDRLASYDGVPLREDERERAEQHARTQAAYVARYVDGPTLTLPVDEAFGYGFDPNGVSIFDGVGQVLTTAEVRGGWGTLTVSSGGVLLERSSLGVTAVVVPAPTSTDPEIHGDGWSLSLADGWVLVPGEAEGDGVVTAAADE